MVNHRLRVLIATICFAIPLVVVAQHPTAVQRHQMNLRMLELVESYEGSLRTSRSYPFSKSKRRFISLYANRQDSLVYSDLMDFRPGVRLSVEDYAKQLEMRQHLMCAISNLNKSDYVWKDGKWHVRLTMDKSVTYYVANESKLSEPAKSMVYFSSLDYYKQPYRITLNCSYDPKKEVARIESVDGVLDSSVPMLPEGFLVVQRGGNKDSRIKIDGMQGDSLSFNSEGQAFVAPEAIKSRHEDIIIEADTIANAQTFSHVRLSYKTIHWRAKLIFATSLGSAFNIKSNEAIEGKKSYAVEIGADIGYTLPLGGKTTMGIYTGLGMSFSALQLKYNNPIEYHYRISDSEGVRYDRQYKITSASEGFKYTDVVIPFYLNFDHKLYNRLYLNWNLGAKIYVNGMVKVNPYTIVGDVKAVYQDGTIVSERESDAIGSISGVYDHFLYPGSYARNSVDVSLLGGVGLSYDIYKGRMLVFAKFGYECGVTKMYEGSGVEFYDANNRVYPIVYSGRTVKNIATRSLINSTSVNRQAAWLELGLTCKF